MFRLSLPMLLRSRRMGRPCPYLHFSYLCLAEQAASQDAEGAVETSSNHGTVAFGLGSSRDPVALLYRGRICAVRPGCRVFGSNPGPTDATSAGGPTAMRHRWLFVDAEDLAPLAGGRACWRAHGTRCRGPPGPRHPPV